MNEWVREWEVVKKDVREISGAGLCEGFYILEWI